MSNAEQPLDDVSPAFVRTAEASPRPQLDEIYRTAESLDADERLRLIVRLWKSLPREHRSALVTLQLEDSLGSEKRPSFNRLGQNQNIAWSKIYERLFDPKHATGLYSAPRRFDLATIFVVTAAFSLMLGGLSLVGAPAAVKIIITGLMFATAATQSLFAEKLNPRGVSIVTGTVAYTLMMLILWILFHRYMYDSFFVVVILNGLFFGGFFGYLCGTVVGGMFLVADALRGKFERRKAATATDETTNRDTSPFEDMEHKSASDKSS